MHKRKNKNLTYLLGGLGLVIVVALALTIENSGIFRGFLTKDLLLPSAERSTIDRTSLIILPKPEITNLTTSSSTITTSNNETVTISYDLNATSTVENNFYGYTNYGTRVNQFTYNSNFNAGHYYFVWNGTDGGGQRLPTGSYRIDINANNTSGSATSSIYVNIINRAPTGYAPYFSNHYASPTSFDPNKEYSGINFTQANYQNTTNYVTVEIWDGSTIIKKLLNNNYYSTGQIVTYWDGTNSYGTKVTEKTYSYKIYGSNQYGDGNTLWGIVAVKYTPTYVNLAAPMITRPANNSLFTNYPRYTKLEWTSVYGATGYQIEFGCDICANTYTKWLNPTYYSTSTNSYTTGDLADNQFRFRVRATANNGSSQGSWSDYIYFRYNTSGTVNPTPTPPANPPTYVPFTNDVGNYCAGFYDVWISSSYCPAIKAMIKKLVFQSSGGNQGALFEPLNNLNRVEAAKVIVSFLQIPTINAYSDLGFSDVDNGAWYAPYLRPLKYNGIIKGYADGTFKPGNSVTRAEFLAMLLRAGNADVSTCGSTVFADAPASLWFGKYLCYAKKYNIIDGDDQNKFYPTRAITRQETALYIFNAETNGLF